jgi:predicted dinucleotide-utilizing enzyme
MTDTQATATTPIFEFLLEKAQGVNDRYALVEGANGVLARYPTLATKAGETYELAKAYVPQEYAKTVDIYEKELCALNKDTLTTHAQTLDSSIHCVLQTAQEKKQQLVDNVQEKKQQLVDNVQEKKKQLVDNVQETKEQLVTAATERAISGIDYVSNGIDYVDSTVDYVLTEEEAAKEGKPSTDTALSAPEKPQSGKVDPSEHVQYVAQKAMFMSKKAQRRLQKKAFEGLSDLRLRSQAIGAVDLIQYNRFLDIDTVMEGATAVSKDVQQFSEGTRGFGEVIVSESIERALKVYEGIEGELVVAVKPVLANLEGKAGDSIAKINEVVVEPAKSFYTTVVQEFLNNPSAAFQDFKSNVIKAVGPEWSKALEVPTMELWESMKAVYGSAPGNVEALIASVGKRLSDAWGGENTENGETATKPLARSNSTAQLTDLANQNDGFPFQKIVPCDVEQ